MKKMPRERPLAPLERARLGLEIVVAYARASRELRKAPIEEVLARLRLAEPPRGAGCGDVELEEARRLGGAVVRTMRFLPGDTRCLRRSLVVVQLLARRGIAARLVIGARTAPDFLAHAWVEHDGKPVLSPLDGSFGRLVEL
jgi:Transglutaminase-like superfamily